MSRTIAFVTLSGFYAGAAAFHSRCSSLTPRVEPAGEGEAFLDLTGTAGVAGAPAPSTAPVASALPPCLFGLAGDLRRLFVAPDLELRAGLAVNRLVARLAAGRVEREGCLTIPPGGEAAFLAPLPPAVLWTISPAARGTLAKLGIATLEEARSVPEPALYRLLGAESFLLLRHAWGRDDSPVPFYDPSRSTAAGAGAGTVAPQRRLSREVSLPSTLAWSEVAAALDRVATELAAELRETGSACLHLDVALVPSAGGEGRRTRLTPREPPATVEALLALLTGAAARLPAAAEPPGPSRLVVEVTPTGAAAQLSLLPVTGPSAGSSSGTSARRPAALEEAVAAVNRAFPAEVLFPASCLSVSRRERLRRLVPGFGHAGP